MVSLTDEYYILEIKHDNSWNVINKHSSKKEAVDDYHDHIQHYLDSEDTVELRLTKWSINDDGVTTTYLSHLKFTVKWSEEE